MVACTAMAILKEEESKDEGKSPESSWEKWKRGGIIGAAALTGGTLMAITGGVFSFSLSLIYIDCDRKQEYIKFVIFYWVGFLTLDFI